MGGCASKPKELVGPNDVVPVDKSVTVPEVTMKPVEGEAPKEEVKAETTEAPLIDLSSPRPEADKAPVLAIAPEINELQANEPATVDAIVVKEDAAAEAKAAPAVDDKKEKDNAVAEKAEEAEEPAVVSDEKKTEKVSA